MCSRAGVPARQAADLVRRHPPHQGLPFDRRPRRPLLELLVHRRHRQGDPRLKQLARVAGLQRAPQLEVVGAVQPRDHPRRTYLVGEPGPLLPGAQVGLALADHEQVGVTARQYDQLPARRPHLEDRPVAPVLLGKVRAQVPPHEHQAWPSSGSRPEASGHPRAGSSGAAPPGRRRSPCAPPPPPTARSGPAAPPARSAPATPRTRRE